MTAWTTDRLRYDGQVWGLRSFPLDDWLAARGFRPVMTSTANWRGYEASWEVVDGQLMLVALDGRQEVDGTVHHLDGLVGLPRGVRSASAPSCRGLVWPLDRIADLPPRWCFAEGDTAAVRVDDPAGVEPGSVLEVDGVLVPTDGATWRHATRLPGWHGLRVTVPDDVEPVTEGWFPAVERHEPADGFGPRSVAVDAYVRRPSGDSGDVEWWSASDLHVAESEQRTLVVEELFGRSAPLVADWFTGSLWAVGGELVEYVHAAFESRFEQNLWLEVEAGRILSARVRQDSQLPRVPAGPGPRRPWWLRLLGR